MTDLQQVVARAAESVLFPAGCADLSLRSPEQLAADIADAVLAAVSGAVGEDVVEAAMSAVTAAAWRHADQGRSISAREIVEVAAPILALGLHVADAPENPASRPQPFGPVGSGHR